MAEVADGERLQFTSVDPQARRLEAQCRFNSATAPSLRQILPGTSWYGRYYVVWLLVDEGVGLPHLANEREPGMVLCVA